MMSNALDNEENNDKKDLSPCVPMCQKMFKIAETTGL
jgi:hypothetical protein